MTEDHLAAPLPLEEHRKLKVFAGEWSGEEMVYPSRWAQGGPATSHVIARIDLNGFYLIQDTRQMREGKAPDDVVTAAKASLELPLESARMGEAITRFLVRGSKV